MRAAQSLLGSVELWLGAHEPKLPENLFGRAHEKAQVGKLEAAIPSFEQ